MTTAFEQFFDGRLFVINVAAREDRMGDFSAMAARFGLTAIQRFEAITGLKNEQGRVSGNRCCVASHRALLQAQIANAWPTMFVFEDDAELIYVDFAERWERFAAELPPDWDQIYIGGHYGEKAIARVSPHVIRSGRMMTTSSYGITLKHAKRIVSSLSGEGPIDELVASFHRESKIYVMTPRACVQRPSFSDLTEREANNSACMLDRSLEI